MTIATKVWREALVKVGRDGSLVAPQSSGAAWKGYETREVRGLQTRWLMSQPVIVSPARQLGYRFMVAEAAWILSGDNRVETIAPFSKHIRQFSDDGVRFFGAYGPKFIEQLSYVVRTILSDRDSRQAVLSIWREQPPVTKDVPCTLSWQFLVRDGLLHCVATMRSSDLWTGVPYDVFNFSMAAALVALELRRQGLRQLQLGELVLTAGSQHLYHRDDAGVVAVLGEPDPDLDALAPLDLNEFDTPEQLIEYLWILAHHGLPPPGAQLAFLRELFK